MFKKRKEEKKAKLVMKDDFYYISNDTKYKIYLHTDRLGSSSAVTDGRGKAVHILSYMPYGETLLDLIQWGYEMT